MIGITNTVLGSDNSKLKNLTPLMPHMTGLTMGDYECLPLTNYYNNNINYSGYKCFDSSDITDDVYCHSVANPTYPLYFGWGCSTKQSKLTALRISCQNENYGLNLFLTRMPKKFDIEASNDKTTWITIETFEESTTYSFKVWEISNNNYYNYYRLKIYSSMGDSYLTFKYCIPYGIYKK